MTFVLQNYEELPQEKRLYETPVPIVGLTGSVASGKSSVSHLLQQEKFPIISADDIIKIIYQENETLEFIKKEFPESVENEKIDFKILRTTAFSNEKNLKSLEDFLHPRIREEFQKQVKTFSSQKEMCVIYDVPLLFEKKLQQKVDLSVLVFTPQEKIIERLMKRDQISNDLAKKMMESQISIERKKKMSHYVIDNSGPLENLTQEVDKFIQKYFVKE